MLFNSLSFGIFLPIVFFGYWAAHRSFRAHNAMLVVASYVFYGWWDWRFLSLIAFSTAVDYFVGQHLGRAGVSDQSKKAALWTSVTVNIGLLGIFKYFNFFAESFAEFIAIVGLRADPVTLQVVLPVGISFYTFQTLAL